MKIYHVTATQSQGRDARESYSNQTARGTGERNGQASLLQTKKGAAVMTGGTLVLKKG